MRYTYYIYKHMSVIKVLIIDVMIPKRWLFFFYHLHGDMTVSSRLSISHPNHLTLNIQSVWKQHVWSAGSFRQVPSSLPSVHHIHAVTQLECCSKAPPTQKCRIGYCMDVYLWYKAGLTVAKVEYVLFLYDI